ncbi:hypothetical protein OHR68_06975 [Spirillospora sp. NBC_00431]
MGVCVRLEHDDRQFPPFLVSEVEEWGRSVEDPLVRELLATSVPERLSGGEVVRLTGQRWMPAVIADFVSAAFYGGRLRTEIRREHRDALFGRPLASVDTLRLPEAERYERPAGVASRGDGPATSTRPRPRCWWSWPCTTSGSGPGGRSSSPIRRRRA